jgi:Uma2 family endonuclease
MIVVEVLSPSSQGDDDGDKRRDFQTLQSLQAYVLVSQDSRTVRVYRRNGEVWSADAECYGHGDQVLLPGLTEPFELADIYDDILDQQGQSLLR